MLANVLSCAMDGLDGVLVDVEVDIAHGLPSFTIVGLGDAAVQESRERVRAALRNSGLSFPMKKLTANLAPADLRKAGPAFDLAIAVGLMMASEQVAGDVARAVFLGELGLDGGLRHIDGVLPMVASARALGVERVFVPHEDAAEAALVTEMQVFPVRTLGELAAHIAGQLPIAAYAPGADAPYEPESHGIDFSDVQGQEHVKRALEVAAAGAHNLLMSGSPGAGKTMMARALLSILPPLSRDEALDVTKIYSVAGQLRSDTPLIRQRPFSSPHHTISVPGLLGGGGTRIRPGMISLAHRGVLFLDELPEFGNKLEMLRQPLEDRVITVSRMVGSVTYPASFMLIGSMNPCPCGFAGDSERGCTCSPAMVTRYQKKISGPLADRIDMHLDVPRVNYEKLISTRAAEPSAAIRERVCAARERQRARLRSLRCTTNAEMSAAAVRSQCRLDAPGERLMQAAMRQLQLSARGYHRILKLARTIADLAASDTIAAPHLAEALQYRPRRTE